jgi:hypothetical protein
MVYVAARQLGCSPTTLRARLAGEPALREVVETERELLIDDAELKLARAVEAGDPWAIQFFLKTQGRSRGYGDRQDVDVRAKVQADVGLTVTHQEALRTHLAEADIERLTRALLGTDITDVAEAVDDASTRAGREEAAG